MKTVILILCFAFLFLLGVKLGINLKNAKPQVTAEKQDRERYSIAEKNKVYKNFLSYDGTKQYTEEI